MSSLLEYLAQGDRIALGWSEQFRWGPLTVLFLLASAWWVKGLAFVAAGALGDARSRRFPLAATCAAMACGAASLVVLLLKDLIDRARPALADPALIPLVHTPDSPSFPSGHAATAFAGAAVVGAFCPRLRWPLYGLAALVALSRVYLGVHFWLDVIAGAALGTAIGLGAVWSSRRATRFFAAGTR